MLRAFVATTEEEYACECRKRRVQNKHVHYLRKHVLPGHEFEHGCVVYSRKDQESEYGYAKGYTAKPKSKGSAGIPLRRVTLLLAIPDYLF